MDTLPDNTELERLLVAATDEPGLRPAFYKLLLDSTVLAIAPPHESVRQNKNGDDVFRFVQWRREDGALVIPFFSSLTNFVHGLPNGASCVLLTTRTLFEATRGAQLHLNPMSDYGRTFVPEEVSLLLSTGTVCSVEHEIVSSEREVGISTVKDPPVNTLNSLIVLYSRIPVVKAGFLIMVHDATRSPPEVLVIGLDVESDMERVARETSGVLQDTYRGDYNVDVMQVQPDGESWSRETFAPEHCFYDRSWGCRLMSLPATREPGSPRVSSTAFAHNRKH